MEPCSAATVWCERVQQAAPGQGPGAGGCSSADQGGEAQPRFLLVQRLGPKPFLQTDDGLEDCRVTLQQAPSFTRRLGDTTPSSDPSSACCVFDGTGTSDVSSRSFCRASVSYPTLATDQ